MSYTFNFADVGGTEVSDLNGGKALNFGYFLDPQRDAEQNKIHAACESGMNEFAVMGATGDTPKKVCLFDVSKQANGGKHFPTFQQKTGACVGTGGGIVLWILQAIEVVRLGDAEQVTFPFWLFTYGKSRQIGGLRGRGEGSFGSAFAEAAKTAGIFQYHLDGLPTPTMTDRVVAYTSAQELDWSNGSAIPSKWADIAKKHLVRSAARIKSADQAAIAIQNYYPITIASDWGGQMAPSIAGGDNPVRLNKRVTTWYHQMAVLAWWDHPILGEIFFVQNSWGPDAHGKAAGDEPAGGFWITRAEMDYICRTGECYAYSQFDGFPAQRFDFSTI